MANVDLEDEAARATGLLRGRTVERVWRHRVGEVAIEFADGVRLFADADSPVELSVTGCDNDAASRSILAKNIQVIDGADNCVYDIFAASSEDYALLFQGNSDVAFAEEFESRPDLSLVSQALERLWENRVPKARALGIHGTLFYELPQKRALYPTLKDEEARNADGSKLRR